MATLNPYLTFNNQCREAMAFYKECLGGELTLMAVSDTPIANQMPPHLQHAIMHSSLKTESLEIMGTDMSPEALVDGNSVHLCLICKSEEEMRLLFDKLSAGGKVGQPINRMFFGLIAELTDKYGKKWVLELDIPNA